MAAPKRLPFIFTAGQGVIKIYMLTEINEDQLKAVTELLQTYLLYAVLALAIILGAIALIIRLKKPENLKKFASLAVGIVLGFSLCVIFAIMSLTLARYTIKNEINTNFWLATALVISVVAFGIVAYALKMTASKAFKPFAITALSVIAIYSVILVIVLPATGDDFEPGNAPLLSSAAANTALYYILSAVLIALLILTAVFGKTDASYGTRSITYAAACIATSFALSYIKFFELPQAGSVTLASLVPVMLYSYMFGARNGVLCGVVYGLLQFMQSPQFNQPMQFFLDYPIAFGFVGLAGAFRGKFKGKQAVEFLAGGILVAIFRYASHLVSGIFVFYTYGGDQNPVIYSMVYNSFVFVDIAIALAVAMVMFASRSFRAQINKSSGIYERDAEYSAANGKQ